MKPRAARSLIAAMATLLITSCQLDSGAGTPTEECRLAPNESYFLESGVSADTPEFLRDVWPGPSDQLTVTAFTSALHSTIATGRGVGLSIWGDKLGVSPVPTGRSVIQGSCLVVDGVTLSNDSLVVADGLMIKRITGINGEYVGEFEVGPYDLSWGPKLGLGSHSVEYTLLINDESVVQVSWEFTILDD